MIDYRDLKQVIEHVKTLGPGHTVFKDPDLSKYNICLTMDKHLYKPEWVVFQGPSSRLKLPKGD